MDLSGYYTKMREHEAAITEEFPVVVSHATSDGGVKGRMTEVTRRIAARLLVEGVARLADAVETNSFRGLQKDAKAMAEQAALTAMLEVTQAAAARLVGIGQQAAAMAAPPDSKE